MIKKQALGSDVQSRMGDTGGEMTGALGNNLIFVSDD
jgi:hypothetical protein